MKKDGRVKIFLLHKRYLAAGLGLLLAAAMLLAACLPDLLASGAAACLCRGAEGMGYVTGESAAPSPGLLFTVYSSAGTPPA